MSSRHRGYGRPKKSKQNIRRSTRLSSPNGSKNKLIRSLVRKVSKSRSPVRKSHKVSGKSAGNSRKSGGRNHMSHYGGGNNRNGYNGGDFSDSVSNRKNRKKTGSKPSSPVNGGIHSPDSDSGTEFSRQSNAPSVVKHEAAESNICEKQRRGNKRQAAVVAHKRCKNAASYRRQSRKDDSDDTEGDRRNGRAEEDDDSDENEPKQYALRSRINPVSRFCIEQRAQSTPKYALRRDLSSSDLRARKPQRSIRRKRLFTRSDSDTTSSSSEDAIQANEEARFERRRLRKMNKIRAQLRPVNEGDLSYSIGVRELIRRKAGLINIAGSDIDPMHIDRSIDFSQIGGLEQHLQSLKEVVLFPLLYGELFARFNIQPPKGILFYGPPGTGKTLVARALANTCSAGERKVAFFMRKGADCLSKWVGESERQLRILFEQAFKMRPSIIFFDEIDGLAPVRSSKQDQIHSSIVSTLLALMDGLDSRSEVVVIGATNRLDAIDPALRRPGRFDRELSFRLPDKNARLEILKIHTSTWDTNKPSNDVYEWLADRTSGYCGADLKSLCTEAVLIALRSRFPQIYSSEDKLSFDPKTLKVERKDFEIAMRRIVPAGRRDFSIPSRVLDDRLKILLEDVLYLVQSHIPEGYQNVKKENKGSCELERIVNALQAGPVVPSARLLLCGSSSNMGQTSYILPVIINRLDHLPVFSLSIANLFSYGSPEERFSHSVQSAIRASSSGTPCVLLIPSIDKWYGSIPTSVWNLLLSAVDSITGFTSILLLATAECAYSMLPFEIQCIFRWQNAIEITPPLGLQLDAYFHHVIFIPACTPPRIFNIEDYPRLPKVKMRKSTKQLTDDEIEELKKLYTQYHLEITLHYEETISRLSRDRRFLVFAQPVDPADVPDYYTYIKNPMDLGTMFTKASSYKTPEEFLNDFRLIHRNAVEYNPDTDYEGRQIRTMAKVLLDLGQRAVLELDCKFLKRLDEVKRLLKENGIDVDAGDEGNHVEQLPVNGSVADNSEVHQNGRLETEEIKKTGIKRRGSFTCKLSQKRRDLKPLKKCRLSHPSMSSQTEVELEDGVLSEGDQPITDSDNYFNIIRTVCANNSNSRSGNNKKMSLKIDLCKLNGIIDLAVKKTQGWPLVNLELLAAALSEKISTYRDKWDRTQLPAELDVIIRGWNCSD